MAAIAISDSSLGALKAKLRESFLVEKSSHLTEALAYSLGYQTHAAFLADAALNASDPPIALLDLERFTSRLEQFGYVKAVEFDFEVFAGERGPAISTVPATAYEYEYSSVRKKAWRNLMVSTINEGLRQKFFSLRPGDNRWVGAKGPAINVTGDVAGHIFDFNLPNGLPACAYISDAGFDEVSVHSAVYPKGYLVRASNAGFEAGEAIGNTWLERRRGAWMQSASNLFTCRRNLVQALADLRVEPMGFGDKGNVIM
jgi:hypothetical protein